jgi:hypothetical protein
MFSVDTLVESGRVGIGSDALLSAGGVEIEICVIHQSLLAWYCDVMSMVQQKWRGPITNAFHLDGRFDGCDWPPRC